MFEKHVVSTGITILHPTVPSESLHPSELKADIVFVHGLNGNPKSTWTYRSSGIFWPVDLLAKDIPDVRVITFGYNARLFTDTNEGRIATYAENLLGDVFASRASAQERTRPLIFICHSLGGQVVKRALCVASRRKQYQALCQATSSVVFLASPHRGSAFATYGDLGRRFVSLMKGGQPSTDATTELKSFSHTLQYINSDFCDIAQEFTIISFFETEKVLKVGLVVPEGSAVLDQPSERSKIALKADHRSICQFEGPNSENYGIILRQLKLLVQEGPSRIRTKLALLVDDNKQGLLGNSLGRRQRLTNDATNVLLDSDSQLNQKRSRRLSSGEDEYMSRTTASKTVIMGEHTVAEGPEVQFNRPHFNDHAYFPRELPMERLKDGLESSPGRSFAVYGLGGVGKTQLTLKYIHDSGHLYRQIFWIVADSDIKIREAYHDLCPRLFPNLDSKPSPEKCVQLVREWFSCNSKYLLVFDNADDPETLKPYWPAAKGTILVTSRGPTFVEQKIVAGGFELQTLMPSEGATFLLKQLSADEAEGSMVTGTDEAHQRNTDATEISKRLGGQLLALTHMASWIRETKSTLAEFLRDHDDEESKTMITVDYKASGVSFNYQWSYATCWSLSFSQVEGKPAARILAILALLDPDNIPSELLEGYAKSTLHDIEPLSNTVTYRLAITELRQQGLVTMDPKSHGISIHRLVQEASIRNLKHTGRLYGAFEDVVNCLSRVYPRQKQGCSMIDSHQECRLLTPQLLSVNRHVELAMAEADPAGVESSSLKHVPLLAELLCHCGWYLYEIDQTVLAISILEHAKSLCETYYGEEPQLLTALICNNIGVIHMASNRPQEALSVTKLALDLRRLCLPPGHTQIGESLSNTASIYHDLDQLDKAQDLFMQSVHILENAPQKNSGLLEGIYSNLGRNLMAMQRYDEADEVFQKAVALHEGLTDSAFFVSLTLFLVGNLRMYQQRWDEAEEHHRRALSMRLPAVGASHTLTGVSYHQLARLLHRRGQDHGDDGAIHYLREAITIFEQQDQEPGLVPRSKFVLSVVLRRVSQRTQNAAILAESEALRQEAQQAVEANAELIGLACTEKNEWNSLVQYEYR